MSAIGDCPFCAIASGADAKAEVVCEAESWVAFFPLDPATPGHTLVAPRVHVSQLWEVSSELGAALMDGVIKVGRAIDAALMPQGMNLITSAGAVAEQTVLHLHLHVVPRWQHDGFGQIWPKHGMSDESALVEHAERIREAYRFTGDG